MTNFRVVNLVDSDKWPTHGTKPPVEEKKYADWRGKEIAIGPALTPHPASWNCGTSKVYAVTDETLARMGFSEAAYGRTFVCEHQFKEKTPAGQPQETLIAGRAPAESEPRSTNL